MRINAGIRRIDSGIRQVKQPVFNFDREIIAHEVADAPSAHQVEFKQGAEVRAANVGCADPRAALHEWNKPGAREEVVTHRRGNPGHISIWIDLVTAEKFAAQLAGAGEQRVAQQRFRDNLADVKVSENEVVPRTTAENFIADCPAGTEPCVPRSFLKTGAGLAGKRTILFSSCGVSRLARRKDEQQAYPSNSQPRHGETVRGFCNPASANRRIATSDEGGAVMKPDHPGHLR
jgi:hypothetical protein